MPESLYDGRRVRLLTILDEGNREGLEIGIGVSLPNRRVAHPAYIERFNRIGPRC